MNVSLSSPHISPFDPSKAEVVVVGAGPVGLWTSIVMKALDKDLNIVVLDQYPDYKRDNPLSLERSSFSNLPKNERVRALVDKIFTDKNGRKVSQVHVNTNTIEELFLQTAQELGIHVNRGPENKITSLDSLNRFSNAKVILGADGSKSQMRQLLFGELASNNDLQYIAQVKYTTQPPKPQRTQMMQKVASSKLGGGHVTEVPKNPKDGEKTGTMNLLLTITKETFEKIQDATFKDPKQLGTCPQKLRERARYWISARNDQDKATQDNVQVSSIKLNSYKSREFVKLEAGKAYGLVGDAAFGVPYFRSLNNGIRCGTHFAQAAVARKQGNDKPMRDYNSFVHTFATWEMGKAKAKSLAVRALDTYINVMGWLPRKVVSWHEDFLKSASREYSA